MPQSSTLIILLFKIRVRDDYSRKNTIQGKRDPATNASDHILWWKQAVGAQCWPHDLCKILLNLSNSSNPNLLCCWNALYAIITHPVCRSPKFLERGQNRYPDHTTYSSSRHKLGFPLFELPLSLSRVSKLNTLYNAIIIKLTTGLNPKKHRLLFICNKTIKANL